MAVVGGQSTVQGYQKPAGYQQITSVSSAVGFTSIPADARFVVIQPTGQNVRWRDDGVDPTATIGMLIVANDMLFYSGDFAAIKFIQVSASAVLNYTFYK